MKKIHSKEKSLKVIFYYITYCIISEAVSYYLHEARSQSSIVLYAIFTVAEFSFFCLFYYYILPAGRVKKAILPIGGLFFLIACFDFFILNKMNSFDSITIGVESILIILMCIYYLIVQIRGSTNLFIYSTSNFWVIITFLIYLSGSFFLYKKTNPMFYNKAFQYQYVIINSVFYILRNILLSIAMFMKSNPGPKLIPNHDDWDDLPGYKLKN